MSKAKSTEVKTVICRFCKTARATHRVVRGKRGRRWAKPSTKPNLCSACAHKSAGAINRDLQRAGVDLVEWS